MIEQQILKQQSLENDIYAEKTIMKIESFLGCPNFKEYKVNSNREVIVDGIGFFIVDAPVGYLTIPKRFYNLYAKHWVKKWWHIKPVLKTTLLKSKEQLLNIVRAKAKDYDLQ